MNTYRATAQSFTDRMKRGHTPSNNKLNRRSHISKATPFDAFFTKFKSPSTSDKLYQLLTTDAGDTFTTRTTLDTLIDQLIGEHAGKPFREGQLGRGPWQVRYSRGQLAWKGWTGAKKSNAASQEFITETREIINRGEILGSWITVSASGRYKAIGESGRLPVMIRASVEGGKVCVLGKAIRLPIKGDGEVELMYIDDRLRVFQSPRNGAMTVQVRDD